jgi:uncharacterized protein YndB with AHSA1/START domain
MPATAHVYEIYIHGPLERVWDALLDPEFTRQYFHSTTFLSDFRPGSRYRNVLPGNRDAVEGVIEEIDPPHRLVMTWHVLYDAALAAEPPGRVEWRLASANDDNSVTRVTLRHGDLALSPLTWEHVRLGWVEILASFKTLIETGHPMPAVDTTDPTATGDDIEGTWHRTQAITANNSVWELLDAEVPDTTELLTRAYAASYHWARAAGRTPENAARASWLLSRCHVVVGNGELALHHADECAAIVADADLRDFDLGYAHEARARALAALGRNDEAAAELAAARAVEVADHDDRKIFESDLEAPPWFGISWAEPPTIS